MSEFATLGANTQCTFGDVPSPLRITSQQKVIIGGQVAAAIDDASGMANVGPYGMCKSLLNPAVAAATAAALGVLTPQPCVPAPAGTWIPTHPAISVSGKPCLTIDCKMMCSYGGTISIVAPNQMTVSAK